MGGTSPEAFSARTVFARLPFYYGWVILVVAALAMVATLPGRTHGLGLITEPLLHDLTTIDRVTYAQINLWATLVGAVFCIPFGWVIDRLGARLTLVLIALTFGADVLAMTQIASAPALFLTLTLTRGLGQGALSLVSLAVVGKWFGRRLGLAMGIYSVVMGLGFMVAFQVVGRSATHDWRGTWSGLGLALVAGLAPLGWLLVRDSPERCGLPLDGKSDQPWTASDRGSYTLGRALRTSSFWAFALASSVFLLISSGTSLFGQAILEEVGFDRPTFINVMTVTGFVTLAANLLGGIAARRWSMSRVMGLAMFALTAALLALPHVRTQIQVYAYASAMGVSAGIVTVIFFAIWAQAFGRDHLGKITGAAQMMTVLSSGLGQLFPALCHSWTGSYLPLFHLLAPITGILGIWVCLARLPRRESPIAPQMIPLAEALRHGELESVGKDEE
jgi:MFS family permease